MTAARPIAFFPDSTTTRGLRWILSATLFAAIAGTSGAADAAGRATARGYDGIWNVTFATQAGNCSSNHSVPFTVAGHRVSSAGGGKVTGGISGSGAVAVRISVGLSKASGSGRLVGNAGAGRWSGIILGDRCSGSWQAARI